MQSGGGPPAGGSGGSGGSGGGGPSGPSGPGGPGIPGIPGGGGGAGGGVGGGISGAPHGGGKLGGNPPAEFDSDRSKADTFMNEFNLYRLTNFDAEQLINPLKRTTLLLGFIKGPNVKDWVRRWTRWTVNEYTTGRPSTDEHYWNMIMDAFQHTFQDTGTRERAEDQLRKLAFAPNAVDIFITQFESLAHEATYRLDDKPTISLFASKLPYKMVDHIYKVVRPRTFAKWAVWRLTT